MPRVLSVDAFDRQVETLLERGYPGAAGLEPDRFVEKLEPLREWASGLDGQQVDLEAGRLPFVIVVKRDLVAADVAMSLVEREGKPGVTKMYPREPEDFKLIDGVDLPNGMAYLLVDIDRGKESLNVTPNDALPAIEKAGRSPLTIDEGIAIVTHHPEFLMKNNCFSLLASRISGDKRMPAIWINGKKQPNLGWCWAGNPHTWLGSASGRARVGI